jgi:hypothetical protein
MPLVNTARLCNKISRALPTLLVFAWIASDATAQTVAEKNRPWPFASKPSGSPSPLGTKGSTPSPTNLPPPRDTPLLDKPFGQLSEKNLSEYGEKALNFEPEKWRHAETENFVIHYRRVTEAQKVAREVEFNLWFIASTLGASKDRYAKKSHVYVFEDDEQWKQFLSFTQAPPWAASFARGDELFLNVRREGGPMASGTLAHETAHAVAWRLYPGKQWPLWLNEGFAEYMGGASVAARKRITPKRYQGRLEMAEMSLSTLESLQEYPRDEIEIIRLYQTSEKFVRFIMNELGKDRIVQFVETALAGKGMKDCVLEVYGDRIKDWDAFEKRFARFTR